MDKGISSSPILPGNLRDGYNRFRTAKYPTQSDLFRTLGNGQSPQAMVISCADSRVEPSVIFDTVPGELFVVRNVANIVPKYRDTDGLHGVEAALEFAVTALKVSQIVVIGHSACGGISACLSAANDKPIGQFISPWVAQLDNARDLVLETKPSNPQKALEYAGIVQSLGHLKEYPFVDRAISIGTLTVHGAMFDIGSGTLAWHDPNTNAFVNID